MTLEIEPAGRVVGEPGGVCRRPSGASFSNRLMVIAVLGAGRGPHADHRPVAHVPQLLRDDVRRRVGVTTTRARKSELSVTTAPLATLGRQKLRRFAVAEFLRTVHQIVQ